MSLCVPLSCDGLCETRRLFPLQSDFSRIGLVPARVQLQSQFLRGLITGVVLLKRSKSPALPLRVIQPPVNLLLIHFSKRQLPCSIESFGLI